MKFDENLAAVHAYLCADGYVIRNPKTQKQKYYMIGFRNTNQVLLKDFQNKFEKIFGKRPYIVKDKDRCRIGSKEIYERLMKKFGSFYSWHWKMPLLNKELSKIWIRAFFDCESWVFCKSHQNRMIGVDCVNLRGLEQIKRALKNLGIESKTKKRINRNTHSLSIFGKNNLMRFREEIGFLHPLKKEKLDSTIKDFVTYYWNFPNEEDELKKFVKKIMLERAKVKNGSWIVRLISNKETNLLKIREGLDKFFNIDSLVNKRINGIGTIYYELNVNRIEEVRKAVKNNLINKEEKEKWLILKK